MKKCSQCGKRFKPKYKKQRVCCEQCLINKFDSLVSKSRALARTYALSLGYQSMSEVRFANKLKRKKIKFKYEPDSFPYQIKTQTYTPDFKIGSVYLEYKGKFDAASRKKMVAVKRCNPKLDIRLVFESPNTFIRKRKTPTEKVSRYFEWAEKNKFRWYDAKDLDKIIKDIKYEQQKSKINAKANELRSKKMATLISTRKVPYRRTRTNRISKRKTYNYKIIRSI